MSRTSTLTLRIYDGTRRLFSQPASFLVTITDGNQSQHVRNFYLDPIITFQGLPFFDNLGDRYTVLVWAQGFRQAGFTPVHLTGASPITLDIMLIATDPGFSFVNARWPAAEAAYPFLGADLADPGAAGARYESFLDYQHGKPLACMLNLCAAMSQIQLAGPTPLAFLKAILWNDPDRFPAQDRFFAWCDANLVGRVAAAAAAGNFAAEQNPGLFHPGATRSWKQIQFGEANVQLTFHENDRKLIDGVACVLVEPDIDYYRDFGAHILLEIVVNALTQSLTDPVQVYTLRWIAARQGRTAEFAPLYTIT